MNKSFLLFLLTTCLSFPIVAQPCGGSSTNTWPTKCFEIVSILVDACDGTNEGQNEMVRLQIGPNPLLISGFSVPAYGGSGFVNWGAGASNPWRGFANFNTTTLNKINSINTSISNSGHCGVLIPLNNNQYVPARSNLLIITSTSFNPTAQNFDNLMDTLYVVIQVSGNTAGHFANQSTGAPNDRKLIINHSNCSDTVTYQKNLLLKQDLTVGAEDGGTVNFTFNGTDSYVNYGCAVPIPPVSFDAGTVTGPFCRGSQVQLNGNVTGTNCYVWRVKDPSKGTLTDSTIINPKFNIAIGAGTGNITIYLALKYNCSSAIDSVIIPLTAISSSIFAGNDTSICKNKVVPLLASTSGVGLISWSTSGLGNFTSTNTLNSTYQPSTTDTGIIYLRVQQQTSCGIIMDSLKLTLIAAPNPNFTFPSGTICEGSTPFTLSPQNLGGLFSGAGIIGSNQFNPSISGTFNIKYLTNNLGCKDSMVHPITVIAKPNPQFSFSNNPVCLGSNPVNLIPNQAGGTFTGLQVIGNQFIPSQAGSFPIKYLITVGGCADSSLQSILVNDLPDPSFNPSKIKVCEGEAPISLNPKTTGGTFSGNSNIQGTNFLPNTPGTFIIKYIVTQNGCTDSTSTTLTVDPKPNAKFLMNDTVFCEGDPIELLNPIQTGGIFSGSYVTGNTFNPILSGKYLLQHTIVAGTCKDSVVKEVLVHKVPKSAFNMSPNPGKIGEPIQFTYTGLNANSFAWTFGNPILGASLVENPTFTFQEANSKEVKLIVESNGCFDTSIQFINIEGLDTLIIPNVFTPNGDSINDYFQPIHLGLKSYQIQIYNRWGGLVFESNSLLNHWDGTYHLEPCPSGVYFYTISAESKAGRNYSTHGTVTLLR